MGQTSSSKRKSSTEFGRLFRKTDKKFNTVSETSIPKEVCVLLNTEPHVHQQIVSKADRGKDHHSGSRRLVQMERKGKPVLQYSKYGEEIKSIKKTKTEEHLE